MTPEKARLSDILTLAIHKNASDIHLKAGVPPTLRIQRQLHLENSFPVLSPEDTQQYLDEITSPEQKKIFYSEWELDFSYNVDILGRFRVNAYLQNMTIAMVFRLVRTEVPSLAQLGLPPVCRELAMKREGLIIITGPTGCGKSTTLAAMLNYMNETVKRNIITIEDPIEFLHRDGKCVFSQREIGMDTHSFANALKHVLRQDPDVILLGEMRDMETMSISLTAAETGHLVLTTLHTPSSFEAIDRFVDAFPPHQQQQVRLQLSTTLQAVIYQVVVPRLDNKGVVPAVEVLIATPAIQNLIREGKTFQMPNFIHSGQDVGMNTLDQALINLMRTGKISSDEAMTRLQSPDNLSKDVSQSHKVKNGSAK